MKKLDNLTFLFIIIALEGYVVLSAELLAMRVTLPFTGTGTDLFAIIIASVLMPLAFGYQAGGNFKRKQSDGTTQTIRKKLLKNIAIASIILLPGLTYMILQFFFYALSQAGIENTLLQIMLYCLVFLMYPVYLLGQTVPLLCHYFSEDKRAQITGKMLFFSTLGSLSGSIFTTLILMDTIGMHHTVSVLFAVLTILAIMIGTKKTRETTLLMISVLGISLILNSNQSMEMLSIVKNNKYSTIMIFNFDAEHQSNQADEGEGNTHLFVNNNDSSMYGKNGEKHKYIEFAEKITIHNIPKESNAKDILVIGAGGFTFGHNDLKNNYIYLDIDKDLKTISEKYLLKEPLQPNKTFFAQPARAYLAQTEKKFDIILVDAYLGGLSIPEHLVTQEFFSEVKEHLKEGAIVVANFIISPNFNNLYSKNIDNTLRSVFPYISRHNIEETFDLWTNSKTQSANFIYIYKHDTLVK